MNWTLARFEFTSDATVGALYDEAQSLICYTLEDAVRKEKVYGKTAIPRGMFQIDYTHSGRFGRFLPMLVDTPFFSSIRMHAGNTTEHTDGCILLGAGKVYVNGSWRLVGSKVIVEDVCKLVEKAQEPIFLSVLGGYSASEMSN